MQYQMSPAPDLAPKPSAPAAPPAVVERAPKPPKGNNLGLILVLLVVVAGAAWWFWPRPAAQDAAGGDKAAPVVVRTATASTGDVVRTLRLTGSTGAEKFASLLVPQLRGSRTESLREGRAFSSPGANYPITSNAGSTSGGGSAGGGSVGSGGGGSSDGQLASTAGTTGGGSSAMRASTSRVSRSGGGGGGSLRTSSSGGGSDLGSTASALVGSGGGGGGGGMSGGGGSSGGGRRGGGSDEFSLVLQDGVKGGTMVKKGDVVAEFDRQYMLMRLEDYNSAYVQMEASFNKLKAEIEVQRKAHAMSIEKQKAALDKAKLDLKTLPVMGAIDTERIKLAAEEAEARYKQLLAEVKFREVGWASTVKNADFELKQARIELARATANADRMILKAPLDGLVVMQTTFRGSEMQQIQIGDQLYAGMRFMQIVDPSSMVVNATVNQVDGEAVRVGQKAKIRFDAFPGLELPATVHAIGAMTKQGGQRAQFVKEIPVVLKIDKTDPRVIPDLTVSVDVEVETEKQATLAPVGSIFSDRATPDKPFVFVKNGQAWERRPVQLGLVNNVVAAIRSGLRPGEVIAAEYPPAETPK